MLRLAHWDHLAVGKLDLVDSEIVLLAPSQVTFLQLKRQPTPDVHSESVLQLVLAL